MVITITGHRPDKLGNEYIDVFEPNKMFEHYGPMSKWIYREIENYFMVYKPDRVVDGLAIGTDQIALHVAIHMGIPVTAAIPFKGQESKWPLATRQWYNYLLSKCDKVVYVCEPGYAAWKMQKRNEWMVDQLTEPEDRVLGVHDGSPGGTDNCINYAKEKHKAVYTINPNEYKELNIQS